MIITNQRRQLSNASCIRLSTAPEAPPKEAPTESPAPIKIDPPPNSDPALPFFAPKPGTPEPAPDHCNPDDPFEVCSLPNQNTLRNIYFREVVNN